MIDLPVTKNHLRGFAMQLVKSWKGTLGLFLLIQMAGSLPLLADQREVRKYAPESAPIKRITLRPRITGNNLCETWWQQEYRGKIVAIADNQKLLLQATARAGTRADFSPLLTNFPFLNALLFPQVGIGWEEIDAKEIWIDFQDIESITAPNF